MPNRPHEMHRLSLCVVMHNFLLHCNIYWLWRMWAIHAIMFNGLDMHWYAAGFPLTTSRIWRRMP